MTITENDMKSDVGAHGDGSPAARSAGAVVRLASVPATGDHKVIGRLWIGTALLWGLVATAIGLILAIDRAIDPEAIDLGLIAGFESYSQFWVLYRFGLLFLVVVPLFIGIATHVVPLQIGSSSLAFPRAANAAYWLWLIASGIFVVSFLVDGGFVRGAEIDALNLSASSLAFMLIAIMLASLTIATTIVTQRGRGMWLDRIPLFSWSMLVAAGIWMLSLPVLLANVVIIWIDNQGNDVVRYANGDLMYQQLAWVFDQPQIFAFLVPVLGIVGDIMPTGFRARPRLHTVSQGAIGMFGLLGFGAYAQPFFTAGATSSPVYVLGALILLLPVLMLAGGWGDMASRGGAPKMGLHMLVAIDALLLVALAGIIAMVRVLFPLFGAFGDVDVLNLTGTTASTALFNVAMAAGLIAGLAGLHFWSSKLFGRKLNGGLTVLAALSLVGGGAVIGITDLISGFMDQPDDPVAVAAGNLAPGDSAIEALNWISMVGSILLIGGIALTLLNLLGSSARKVDEDYWDHDEDPDNPWGGHTLEWATSSPPPLGNFSGPIDVTSPYPLLDQAGES